MTKTHNPAHALDGGIPSRLHIALRWPAASDVHRWAAILMSKKRLNCALKTFIAISLTPALVSCTRHTPPSVPAWVADADQVVVQGGIPLVEGHLGDPLILSISGQKANEFKQAIASAEPIGKTVGIRLLYEGRVYHGTNYLGEILSYGDLFCAGDYCYRDNKGILKSLIDTQMRALAKAQSRPNPEGRANGRQPFGSETNSTSGAAASRRSP